MASGDRFYLLQLRHRPACMGDIGSALTIAGLVIQGGGESTALLLPGAMPQIKTTLQLALEEWSEFIQRSDNPEVLVREDGKDKVFHRKIRYQISGEVQQRIWAADGFRCMYCGIAMGKRLMTIDHFIPLENGGLNTADNYITACTKCNKDKGGQHPAGWLKDKYTGNDYQYQRLVTYLQTRKL